MKIEEQTGSRSAAETEREPWEPCSAREEIGITVFYLAERLCYRVAFLLSGAAAAKSCAWVRSARNSSGPRVGDVSQW